MAGLSRQAALVAIGRASAAILGLAMAMCLSRILPKDEFGAFGQLLVVYNLVTMVLAFGLPTSLYYFLPKCQIHERTTLIAGSVLVLTSMGAIGSVVLWCAAGWMAEYFRSEDLAWMLKAFAPTVGLMVPVLAIEPVLMSRERVSTLAVFQFSSRAASVAAVCIPAAMGASIQVGLALWSATAAATLVWALWLMFAHEEAIRRWALPRLEGVFRYSANVTASALLALLLTSADKILVAKHSGPSVFAEYRNGAFEFPLISLVTGAIFTVLLPKFSTLAVSGGGGREILDLWMRASRKSAVLLVPTTVLCFAFAGDIVIILFGDAYASSAPYFQVFLLLVAVRIAPIGPLALALGLSGHYTSAHVAANAVAWGLGALGLALTGSPLAAASAFVLSNYVIAGMLLVKVGALLRVPLASFAAVGLLPKLLAVCIPAGVVARIVCDQTVASISAGYAAPVLRLVLGGAVYLVIAAALVLAHGGRESEIGRTLRELRGT